MEVFCLRGKLIAFEGIDAVGKATQVQLFVNKLNDLDRAPLYFKFPTYESTPYGMIVREYLQGKFGGKDKVSPYVGSMFYALDRLQFRETFHKELRGGRLIVCDRYKLSNIFQVANAPESEWREIFDWLQRLESPMPDADATIWIDLPAEQAFLHKRESKDILEQEAAFQKRVRKAYGWVSELLPVIRVDGMSGGKPKSKEQVAQEIWSELEERGVIRV